MIPAPLVVDGPRPTWQGGKTAKPPICRDCGMGYDLHSGKTCVICKRPIEHHKDGEIDEEIAGLSRMAEAKSVAGKELTPAEAWCFAELF